MHLRASWMLLVVVVVVVSHGELVLLLQCTLCSDSDRKDDTVATCIASKKRKMQIVNTCSLTAADGSRLKHAVLCTFLVLDTHISTAITSTMLMMLSALQYEVRRSKITKTRRPACGFVSSKFKFQNLKRTLRLQFLDSSEDADSPRHTFCDQK